MKFKKIDIDNLPEEEVLATDKVYYIVGWLTLEGDLLRKEDIQINCYDEQGNRVINCTHYITIKELEELEELDYEK